MKYASTIAPFLALAATIGLAACESTPRTASTNLVPGHSYNAVPPRLVQQGTGVSNDQYACASAFPGAARVSRATSAAYDCADMTKRTAVSWDRPDHFGPVPSELRARGEASCATLGAGWRVTGYHPAAQLADGTTAAGGGYYCRKDV